MSSPTVQYQFILFNGSSASFADISANYAEAAKVDAFCERNGLDLLLDDTFESGEEYIFRVPLERAAEVFDAFAAEGLFAETTSNMGHDYVTLSDLDGVEEEYPEPIAALRAVAERRGFGVYDWSEV